MYIIHELRDRLRRLFGQVRLKNARLRRGLLGGLFFALLTAILASQVAPQRVDVKIGDVATRDIAAPRPIINRVATKQKQDAAVQSVPIFYKVDPAVRADAESYVADAFNRINVVRGLTSQDIKTRVDSLTAQLNLGSAVPPDVFASLLSAEDAPLNAARLDAQNLVRLTLAGEVKKEDIADLRAKIDQESEGFTLTVKEPWLKTFVKELVKSRIRSNMVEDVERTQQVRKAAALSEDPVEWKKDQLITKKGDPVTEEQYETLKDLRMVGSRADFRSWLGTAILSLILVALTYFYLWRFRPDILEQDHKLFMLGLIGVITILLCLLMKGFTESLQTGAGYLMPIAFNSILVTILLDSKLALLQGALLALMAGMSAELDPISTTLVGVVGSAVGTFAVTRVESRTDIYRAGLLVSAGNVVAIMSIYLLKAYSILELRPWLDAGLGAANGLVVAVLVTGALPFFENLFGIVTPLKLLELSNPNHPLLKRLLVEAPGSYHHTILVANLCEAAAEAVGADQVLARVGAYYHDIGKTKRPYFFVENQFAGENPHTKLPPSLSALIITSHVKDGLEMAREARLPKEITDFIPEHHGTSLVSYFYHMASKSGQAEYVLEEDFRYDGPKPRSKETAICMLADGCEASVRAIRQKGAMTLEQIESQVRRIIDDRLKQGQLDNCDLTLRDLDSIAKVFVRVLSGVHHMRIEYPAEMQGSLPGQAPAVPPADEAGEESTHGGLDQQRPGEGHGDGGANGTAPAGGGQGDEPGGSGSR